MRSQRAKIMMHLGFGCRDFGAIVKGNVRLGKSVYIARGAEVIANKNDAVWIGDHTFILKGALVYSYGGNIKIGSRVGINPYAIIYGHGGVEIGDNVMVAAHTIIIPANHNTDRIDIPMNSQGLTCKGIRIEEDAWLGARVTVLDGVTIGKGSVVGAGSVVNESIPPYSIAVGVPARVIGSRLEGTKRNK
ncbi:MAG: acyltransferase [Desulfomonilaceae bacterium]